LVTYKREGGVGGASLVPDLATSLPVPTDDGHTYTFQLRQGIHYSTGARVRPADFRYALERGFKNRVGPTFYFTKLVGGQACARRPAACDLSRGVVANDADGTVTFHLTTADPEFLYQLALPIADAVPVGAPVHLPKGTAVPATGAYEVASYDPLPRHHQPGAHGRVVLVRNPQFRQWSAAAQPTGFPDRIEVSTGYSSAAQVAAVEGGTADSMWDEIPVGQVSRLTQNYPEQVHENSRGVMSYLYLNSRIPPFNDRRARLAINYAVNRRQLAEDARGTLFGGQLTCQIIPPNYPGYVRRCPFTLDSSPSGRWTAPDISRARRLVRRSGTRGDRVTVLTSTDFPKQMGPHIVDSLNAIGYHALLKVLPGPRYFEMIATNRNAQVGLDGWAADYVTASNFINTLVSCEQIAAGNNIGHFCDAAINERIHQALADQSANPGRATLEWASLDRDLLVQAPIVPIANGHYVDFVARRAGNYQAAPEWGELVDQLWVR